MDSEREKQNKETILKLMDLITKETAKEKEDENTISVLQGAAKMRGLAPQTAIFAGTAITIYDNIYSFLADSGFSWFAGNDRHQIAMDLTSQVISMLNTIVVSNAYVQAAMGPGLPMSNMDFSSMKDNFPISIGQFFKGKKP